MYVSDVSILPLTQDLPDEQRLMAMSSIQRTVGAVGMTATHSSPTNPPPPHVMLSLTVLPRAITMPPTNPRTSILDNPRASIVDVANPAAERAKLGIRPPTPKRPTPSAPFHPPADTSTYRDLLLFEERLKMNAEMLRRRRSRYRSA